jgi:phosphatidylglycerol:prolipoprotein diacylglycerol transferase
MSLLLPIGLDPVAFSLGGLEIRWYGIIVALSILTTLLIARAGARRAGLATALVDDAALWVGVSALIGGRLLYLVQNELPDLAMHPLHAFAIWHGGLSFYGLIAGLVGLAVWARRRGVVFGIAADVVAPAVAAGQAVGHIGCLIGGDSYGLPTDGPFAVVYRHPDAMAPQGIPLHPTQLYEAVSLGILAVVLWASRGRLERLGPGATAAVYLVGNAAIRFGLFFLRDDVVVFAGLTVAQVIAIGIALAGVTWLLVLRRRGLPTAEAAASLAPATSSTPTRTQDPKRIERDGHGRSLSHRPQRRPRLRHER